MKIVQVCPYDLDRTGGVQRNILSLAEALRSRGHEVAIVAPGPGPKKPAPGRHYVGGKRQIGISGTRFEVSYANAAERRELMASLEQWGAELFHFHTIWTPLMPLQLFRDCRAATVATFHDTPPPTLSGRLLKLIFKGASWFLLRRLDGAIAVSKAPAAHLRPGSRGTVPRIVPPATDLSVFREGRKNRNRDETGPLRVLFVGRLETRKGAQSLIDAWQFLPDLVPEPARPLELVIAGEGALKQMLEDRVRSLRLAGVRFTTAPCEADVIALMLEADIFVAPSLYGESFGIVLTEAMSAGLPVIAADNAGYSSVMEGGGEHWLYPAGDVKELAKRIAEMVCDREARRAAAEWGVTHAARFDVAELVMEFEEIYKQALAASGRA